METKRLKMPTQEEKKETETEKEPKKDKDSEDNTLAEEALKDDLELDIDKNLDKLPL